MTASRDDEEDKKFFRPNSSPSPATQPSSELYVKQKITVLDLFLNSDFNDVLYVEPLIGLNRENTVVLKEASMHSSM